MHPKNRGEKDCAFKPFYDLRLYGCSLENIFLHVEAAMSSRQRHVEQAACSHKEALLHAKQSRLRNEPISGPAAARGWQSPGREG